MNFQKTLNSLMFSLLLLAISVSTTHANTRMIKNLDILDVWTYNYNSSHWIEQANIQPGVQMYGEAEINVVTLPKHLYGCDWIQTAYGSKTFDKKVIATFQLTANAEVYIAHSVAIKTKPEWLKSFTKTGENIINSKGTVFELFKKRYAKGDTVRLGANGNTLESMYLVIVKPVESPPSASRPDGKIFDVLSYGAKGNNKTMNTVAIQTAIDECSKSGGGSVFLHDGIFITGTLELKDNVSLYVQEGSILRGSPQKQDYPEKKCALKSFRSNENFQLIYAEKKKNIAIKGGGVIDGYALGEGWPWKGKNNEWERPRMIRMVQCNNITIQNISLLRSPNWTQYYEACNNMLVDDIRIRVYSGVNNNDGIDISGCKKVEIKNYYAITGDDGICIKSLSLEATEDLDIHDCLLRYANCHTVKIGTETHGDVRNVHVKNIVGNCRYGIAIESVDGANVENITCENILLTSCATPLFIRLGNRGRVFEGGPLKAPIGSMKNITIRNITNTDVHYLEQRDGPGVGSAIGGLPDRKIENLLIENCNLKYFGSIKDTAWVYRDVPENIDKYPEYNIYGVTPSYGIYARHIKNLTIRNTRITCKNFDIRPAIALDDVVGYTLQNLNCESYTITTPSPVWHKQKGPLSETFATDVKH